MKRTFACLACAFILALALPSMRPNFSHYHPDNAGPFETVALAGHQTMAGGLIECTCEIGPDGVCPCCGYSIFLIRAQDDSVDDSLVQPAYSAPTTQPDSGFASGLFLLMLTMLAWSSTLN